ncbi:MAG: amino acid adenylation domain-containing protein [Holophagales bacterium]|nr:amino acid adenylation domain-containing protein [Holophagales bacterium]
MSERWSDLSFGQERLCFLHTLEGIGSTLHVAFTERFRGKLDVAALATALQQLYARQPVLRSVFRADGETFRTAARAPARLHVPRIDLMPILGAVSGLELPQRVQALIRTEVERPFDLAAGPPIRACLYGLDADDHLLLVVLHHLVTDGLSVWLLRRQLLGLYRELARGENPAPAAPAVPYAELAAAERRALVPEWRASLLEYWRRQLAGIAGHSALPTSHPRPRIPTFRAGSVELSIPGAVARGLESLGREHGVSLFVVLVAACQTLAMRLGGEEDVVVGAPFVGRTVPGSKEALGFFANTLPLRSDLSGNPPFVELLQRVRKTVYEAFAHQELPFQAIVEGLGRPRLGAEPPIFQTTIRLLHREEAGLELEGLERSFTDVFSGGSAHDLGWMLEAGAGTLTGRMEYLEALFEPAMAERIARRFEHLLGAVCAHPEERLWRLPCLPEQEASRLRRMSLGPGCGTGPEKEPLPIHEQLARRASAAPEALALVSVIPECPASLTYGELAARARALAGILRGRGIGAGSVVAVRLPRGPALIETWLAVLEAGAAYLPLELDLPEAWAWRRIEASGVAAVIEQGGPRPELATLDSASAIPVLFWDELERQRNRLLASGSGPSYRVADGFRPAADPDALACVMTTSGSTGEPLGVEITHRGILRLFVGDEYARFGPEETFLHLSPVSFDASTFEIWGALLHGGRVVLAPGGPPDLERLGSWLSTHSVTTLWLTASLFAAVVDERPEILRGVRQLITGGEPVSAAHVRRALQRLPETRIVNAYGPTEATTFACCYPVARDFADHGRSVPVGRPIAGTRAYVLDRELALAPIGVEGDLFLGGDGIARGYRGARGRAERATAGRFLADPFAGDGRRMYRTGDRARWRADGVLELQGRHDRQLKLRGFRIEPAEIESALEALDGVARAAVEAVGGRGGEAYLVAYVVPEKASSPSAGSLRAGLRKVLPEPLIPSRFVELSELPLTPRGKLDRRALADPIETDPPEADSVAGGRPGAGPRKDLVEPAGKLPLRDEVESTLLELFSDLLGSSPIGTDDDFFELGGHSLLAARLQVRIREIFGRDLPPYALFDHPTVARLSDFLVGDGWAAPREAVVTLGGHHPGWPLFGVCGLFGHAFRLLLLARELEAQVPFHALQPPGMAWPRDPAPDFEAMAEVYVARIQQLQPEGPIRLLGTSFGGAMCFEMACRLQDLGRQVALLAMVDTMPAADEDPAEWLEVERWLDDLRGRTDPEAGRLEAQGLEVAERQLEALRAYRPTRVFRGEIAYFLHTRHGLPGLQDRRLGWHRRATEGLRLFPVGGVHGRFAENPARRRIARRLDVLLATPAASGGLSLDDYRRRHLGYTLHRDGGGRVLILPSGELPFGEALVLAPPQQRTGGPIGRIEEVIRIRGRLWIAGQVVDPAPADGAAEHDSEDGLRIVVFAGERPLHAAVPERVEAGGSADLPEPAEIGPVSRRFTCLVDLLGWGRDAGKREAGEPEAGGSLQVIAVGAGRAEELEGSPIPVHGSEPPVVDPRRSPRATGGGRTGSASNPRLPPAPIPIPSPPSRGRGIG